MSKISNTRLRLTHILAHNITLNRFGSRAIDSNFKCFQYHINDKQQQALQSCYTRAYKWRWLSIGFHCVNCRKKTSTFRNKLRLAKEQTSSSCLSIKSVCFFLSSHWNRWTVWCMDCLKCKLCQSNKIQQLFIKNGIKFDEEKRDSWQMSHFLTLTTKNSKRTNRLCSVCVFFSVVRFVKVWVISVWEPFQFIFHCLD